LLLIFSRRNLGNGNQFFEPYARNFLLSFFTFLSACFSFNDLAGSFLVAFCTVFSFDIKLKIWEKVAVFWDSDL